MNLVLEDVPLTSPGSVGYPLEGRIEAEDVVGDVAFLAEKKLRLVVALTTAFAYRTVETAPATIDD